MFSKRRLDESDKLTLSDARNIVIRVKQLKNLSDYTLKAYHRTFNDLEKFFGTSDIDMTQLTNQDVKNYIYWQLYEKIPYSNSYRTDRKNEKGVSISTINNYLIVCRAIFNVLIDEGLIDKNVFEKVDYLKEDEQVTETLTVKEINQLFKAFDKRSYVQFRNLVICYVMLDCFSRISETLQIKIGDINFSKNAITFKRTKGRKIRTVPFSFETKRLLQELIRENEVFDTDYVFITIHGTKLNDSTFRKDLKKIAKKAGIKKRVHSHIFRHTASKMFIENDGNIRVLQLLLGHASVETTEKYAHVLNTTINKHHNKFSVIKRLRQKGKTRTSRKRR